ncbi:pentatricopeptide repeat-containing protein At5g16860 [Rutidosis leptorrhynchoides]|uniref:pentatricopeptide repeat-containing protein At5g16860 n=1 Tax=Rutidosis leptorrhynchoides TaxID=125765 RepID=UPI003A9A20AC
MRKQPPRHLLNFSISSSSPQQPHFKHFPVSFFTTISPRTQQCSSSLTKVKLHHQQLTVNGLQSPQLIDMYISRNPSQALAILTRLPPSPSSAFYWNSLIQRAVRSRLLHHALDLFRDMHVLGWRPDGYTFPFVFKACGELSAFRIGVSLHGVVCVLGYEDNVFVGNALVAMYGRCGDIGSARQVFDEMLCRKVADVISWNSIVAAYMQNRDSKKAIQMFYHMTNYRICADAVSLVNILPAFASVRASMQGKEAHAYALKTLLAEDLFVGNAIVDMYAKCELMDDANKVFEQMKVKDVVSWNAMVTGYSQIGRCEDALGLFEKMREENIELNVVTWSAVIAGYAQRGYGYEALDVFRQMLVSGSQPNVVTLVSLLSGCACAGTLLQGKEIHSYCIKKILNIDKNDPGDEQMVINSLIDMYAKCKAGDLARKCFDSVAPLDRNVVTWTAMIGGYSQHGDANNALELFSHMLKQNKPTKPNAFTISCALMACARFASLRLGKQIHGYVIRSRYEKSDVLFVDNCIIDMYVKSGDVDVARVVFNNMNQTNVVSWTSLLTGYGMHGRGLETLELFNKMRNAGLPIDGVTFIVVLYACSHSGLVEKGLEYFDIMTREFGIVPGVEHYACMVDLLGRAGQLEKAMEVIKNMPMEPSPVVWVALLGSCRVHTNVELGEYASNKLLELGCENDGTYTLLSNIYANARRWKDVAKVRFLMKDTGIRKRPGCSWVQGKTGTATFYVGDKTHPLSHEMYNLLGDLMHQIKALGYVPDMSFALHDVDDEEKGDILVEHSEKLALAYGILTTAPGVPIRITKNLRVCGDCHVAIMYISKIIEHEVILRDSSRFHHFKNGYCSCKGYW